MQQHPENRKSVIENTVVGALGGGAIGGSLLNALFVNPSITNKAYLAFNRGYYIAKGATVGAFFGAGRAEYLAHKGQEDHAWDTRSKLNVGLASVGFAISESLVSYMTQCLILHYPPNIPAFFTSPGLFTSSVIWGSLNFGGYALGRNGALDRFNDNHIKPGIRSLQERLRR